MAMTPEQRAAFVKQRAKEAIARKREEEAAAAKEEERITGKRISIGSDKKVNVEASRRGGLIGGPMRGKQQQQAKLKRLEGSSAERTHPTQVSQVTALREKLDPGSTWSPEGVIKPYTIQVLRRRGRTEISPWPNNPKRPNPNRTVWTPTPTGRQLTSVAGVPASDLGINATITPTETGTFTSQVQLPHLSHQFGETRSRYLQTILTEAGINRLMGPTGDINTSLKKQHLETGDVPPVVRERQIRLLRQSSDTEQ